MIVIVYTGCMECGGSPALCGHKKYPTSYVIDMFDDTTVTSYVLDEAITFDSLVEAEEYLSARGSYPSAAKLAVAVL